MPSVAVIRGDYQPYLTNALQHGNPFVPAVRGDDGRNVESGSATSQFLGMNRVDELATFLGSRSSVSSRKPVRKFPFSVVWRNWSSTLPLELIVGMEVCSWCSGILLLILIKPPFTLRGRSSEESVQPGGEFEVLLASCRGVITSPRLGRV